MFKTGTSNCIKLDSVHQHESSEAHWQAEGMEAAQTTKQGDSPGRESCGEYESSCTGKDYKTFQEGGLTGLHNSIHESFVVLFWQIYTFALQTTSLEVQ